MTGDTAAPLEASGHTAHLRTATMLLIPTPAGTCSRQVLGSDLDQALLRDADRALQAPSENPDRGEADRSRPEEMR